MNKDSSIKFRITKEEKEVLITLAKKYNMTLTDYLLYCINNSYLSDIHYYDKVEIYE